MEKLHKIHQKLSKSLPKTLTQNLAIESDEFVLVNNSHSMSIRSWRVTTLLNLIITVGNAGRIPRAPMKLKFRYESALRSQHAIVQ